MRSDFSLNTGGQVTQVVRGCYNVSGIYRRYEGLLIILSRLTRDGTAEPVSRDQILRRKDNFPCLTDHVQD